MLVFHAFDGWVGGGGGVNQGWVCNKNRRVTNEFDVDRRLKARTLFFSYEIAN